MLKNICTIVFTMLMIIMGLILTILSFMLYTDFSEDLTVRGNHTTANTFYLFVVAIVVSIIVHKVYSRLTQK